MGRAPRRAERRSGRWWIDDWSAGDYSGGNGDQRGSDADGECGAGSANDHHVAGESDGDGGTDVELRGGGGGNGAAELPVAEERCEHRGGHVGTQHDRWEERRGGRSDAAGGGG